MADAEFQNRSKSAIGADTRHAADVADGAAARAVFAPDRRVADLQQLRPACGRARATPCGALRTAGRDGRHRRERDAGPLSRAVGATTAARHAVRAAGLDVCRVRARGDAGGADAVLCGRRSRDWALDPTRVRDAIALAPAQVGAVLPVVPFGRPIDVAAWDDFRAATGLPVVIDAAAGFDSLLPGATPAVVSLHATKVLGAGEGGFVISRDNALIRAVRSKSNFGFQGTREAQMGAANAKLSEYQAAVAHAGLDEWPQARAQWMAAADAYRRALAQAAMSFQNGFGQSWITSTCVIDAGEAAPAIETLLGNASVATRRWWGNGAHAHAATREFPRLPLPATTQLAKTTIAVPFFRDIEPTAGREGRRGHPNGAAQSRVCNIVHRQRLIARPALI